MKLFLLMMTALPAFTPGDVNGDSVVSVADIRDLVSHMQGYDISGFVEQAADVNGDNKVDMTDILTLSHFLNHPDTPLPLGENHTITLDGEGDPNGEDM